MATLQFPDSPGPNAVYDAPNGVQYVWTGEYWAANDAEDKYDARYVKVTGDNMTGDLTLGGDKIDLDASSGDITAAGTIRSELETNTWVNVNGNGIIAQNPNSDTSNVFFRGRTSSSDNKFTVFTDGSITAAGTGIFGGDADDGANPGIRLASVGAIAACRAVGNTSVFSGYTEGNSTPNISLNADGSSSFKGAIEVDRAAGTNTGVIIREAGTARTRLYASGNIQAAGTLTCGPYDPGSASAHGATLNVDGTVGTCQVQAADGTATNASAIVVRLGASTAWTVNYGGDAAFRNAFLKLDPDNPANYVSTTNADGETESVYNGPTLDMKKVGLALVALKAAAAASTDYTSLKSAIATALADL